MYFLLIANDNQSYYVYINDFNKYLCKEIIRGKKYVADIVCNGLVMKKYW